MALISRQESNFPFPYTIGTALEKRCSGLLLGARSTSWQESMSSNGKRQSRREGKTASLQPAQPQARHLYSRQVLQTQDHWKQNSQRDRPPKDPAMCYSLSHSHWSKATNTSTPGRCSQEHVTKNRLSTRILRRSEKGETSIPPKASSEWSSEKKRSPDLGRAIRKTRALQERL